MSYDLYFIRRRSRSSRDWILQFGSGSVRSLTERLQSPRVPGSRVKGAVDRYKIKIRNPGFRLIYDLQHHGPNDQRLVVLVLKKRADNPYGETGKRSE